MFSTPSISIPELQARLAANPALALLDVRTREEFEEGHVAEARHQPLDELEPRALFAAGRLPADQMIYLICRTERRAARAAEIFAQAGHSNVVVVLGGTQGWIEAGLTVKQGQI
jgi:rhodanese-related sulfurtransferase